MSFLMRLGLNAARQQEGPLRDIVENFKTKLDEFRKFWRTRERVLTDLSLIDRTPEELRAAGLMTPWKFNLYQSAIAAAPALIVKAVLDFWVPAHKPEGVDAQVSSVFGWLWPIAIPFIFLILVRMIAWGSIKKMDDSPTKRKRAASAYLYLDGAYSLFPQTLIAVGFALSSVGSDQTPLQTIFRQAPVLNSDASGLSLTCYGIGTIVLFVAVFWEGILKRFVIGRKLFVFNGYARRFKWFWMFRDKGRNLGPWNKYIFAYAYAVPLATTAMGLLTLGISWLLGGGLFLLRGSSGT
jgi:hypothetical protein